MKPGLSSKAVRSGWYLLAAVLGLSAGWAWHAVRNRQPLTRTVDSKAAVVSADRASTPNSSARGAAATDESAAAANDVLAQALATAPRVERWLLLVAAAEKAAPDEMPRLLRLCGGDRTALRMVAARWAERHPGHMWQSLLADDRRAQANAGARGPGLGMSSQELAEVLMDSWISRDPVAARAALSVKSEALFLQNLRLNALRPLMKSDPESAVRLVKQWKMRHFYPDYEGLSEWATREPVRAASVVRELGGDPAGLSAMRAVGAAWAKTDPQAALAFATDLPGAQRAAFASGAIHFWAEKDAAAAAGYVAALPDATRRAQLAVPLVGAWAKTEPEQALAWTQDSLRGEARATALGVIIGSVAGQDVGRAAALVAGLDAGGSKNKAIASLVDPWLAKAGGAAVADWLLKLPEADAREAGFEQLGFRWLWNSGKDGAAQAAALATGPQRELVPLNFTLIVAGNEARRDPEAAMKWAGDLPAAHVTVAREHILGEWLQSRPEAATQWVLAQPPGPTRHEFISATTRSLAWNSTDGTVRQFFADLPAPERTVAREILRSTPLPDEKREGLLQALESP